MAEQSALEKFYQSNRVQIEKNRKSISQLRKYNDMTSGYVTIKYLREKLSELSIETSCCEVCERLLVETDLERVTCFACERKVWYCPDSCKEYLLIDVRGIYSCPQCMNLFANM